MKSIIVIIFAVIFTACSNLNGKNSEVKTAALLPEPLPVEAAAPQQTGDVPTPTQDNTLPSAIQKLAQDYGSDNIVKITDERFFVISQRCMSLVDEKGLTLIQGHPNQALSEIKIENGPVSGFVRYEIKPLAPYYNPADEYCNHYDASEPVSVEFFDINGKVIIPAGKYTRLYFDSRQFAAETPNGNVDILNQKGQIVCHTNYNFQRFIADYQPLHLAEVIEMTIGFNNLKYIVSAQLQGEKKIDISDCEPETLNEVTLHVYDFLKFIVKNPQAGHAVKVIDNIIWGDTIVE